MRFSYASDLARAAERDVTLIDAESRRVMEAYARGVNQFIEQHKKNLPLEFSLLRYKPQALATLGHAGDFGLTCIEL